MKFLPNVIALFATLVCTAVFDWGLGSLVWSFWLSSLALCTSVIFVALANNVVKQLRPAKGKVDWREVSAGVFSLFLLPGGLIAWHLGNDMVSIRNDQRLIRQHILHTEREWNK
jgi:hypothetical protein